MKRQTYILLLKILGSLAFVFLLITQIEWERGIFVNLYQQLNLPLFVLSLSGVIIVLGLKSVRWNLLLKAENCDYSYLSAFSAYMVSLMIGLVTPGRIGEIAKLYYVRQEKEIDFYHSFKTIVTDRIFDFAFLIWFGLAGMLYFYKILGDFSGITYILITAITMFLAWYSGYLVLKSIKSQRTIIAFIRESWNEMFMNKMFIPWILTFAAYLASYASVMLIFWSINIKLNIIDVAFIVSLMNLVTLIPITLAGFGTREVSLIYLLSFYAIGPEQSVVFSFLQFIAFFLWGGLIGLAFWIRKPLKLKLIIDDSKKMLGFIKRRKNQL
ncbi:MAG TPA: lysylphosphatidylglycerol synthase transmembrane domain-containing protein [Lentimicrobium sp.]|nr:lysylphosphatidylglycerol synthase transmembrane domain-containing protein [Lentimicrobium sp.]